MSKRVPLLVLRDQYNRYRRGTVDFLVIATQLGIVPDLRYLVDGLERSRACISSFNAEMADCLRAVPGVRLEPDALVDEIQHLIRWAEAQGWDEHDPRLKDMARPLESDPHPLAGYCLSVAHHWANLFYTLEPGRGRPAQAHPDRQPFESLMAEFSTYVLAAQSMVEPDDYLSFCSAWWSMGLLPERPLFADRRLASRLASASRAMRRITLIDYRDLFDALTDLRASQPFHERVSLALTHEWSEPEQRALDAIARLLEEVRVGWQRPGSTNSRGGAPRRPASRKTVHKKYKDGYVRVAETDSMMLSYQTDEGLAVELVQPMPLSVEGLARTLLAASWDDVENVNPFEVRKKGAEDQGMQLEAALEEARIQLDGSQWIPAIDAAGSDDIEAVAINALEVGLGVSSAGIHPGNSSKWAAEHVRRHHFAHGLTKSRLQFSDAKQVLEAIRREAPDSENIPGLICLHASIALGRSFDEATHLQIHSEMPALDAEDDRIHYVLESRQWLVHAPALAWGDMPENRDARVQWRQIRLNDQTGFHALLQHVGLDHDGQPVKRLSGVRRKAIPQWLRKTLPDADASLSLCAQFLFYRLLAISRGDLGIARLITGTIHSHGGSIAHYAHYEAPRLWHAYRQAWSTVPRPYAGDGDPDSSNATTVRGYGAKRVPTAEAVRRLITFLQEQIRSARGAERSNFYTAYTLVGLVLGLGMRPVTEPRLMDIGEGIADLLVVTYLDKARTDYHRRINAVPRSLATHLDRYARYLRTQDRWRNPQDPLPPVFRYIDPLTGKQERFKPSDFERLARRDFGLELYALRRFARTRLIEDPEVHAEDLDGYMGHWFHRVSPHDPLSTYPMMRLHEFARGPVSRMLQGVGFKPLWIGA